jgi:type 1 fimbriae regulatory protein FimB/type 1 fimbriae regulatory protein FimE
MVDEAEKADLASKVDWVTSALFTNSQTGVSSQIPLCPQCNTKTEKVWKDGTYTTFLGDTIQRWTCRRCGHRFSNNEKLDASKQNIQHNFPKTEGKQIKKSANSQYAYQIGALEEAKNLEPTYIINNVGVNANIENHLAWMKKEGYKPSTMLRRRKILYGLMKLNADLNDPESVKTIIADQEHWKASQKQVVVFAYDLYAKQYGISWKRPWYEAVRELPFIPQEREIDDLIAGVQKEIGLLLLIAKETGARAGEIYGLLWTDIDFEGRTLSIRAEKGSNPRRFTMSKKLQNMLECYPKKTERIFTNYKSLNSLRRTFERQRKVLAVKLCNPRLSQIKIHTLRHWKGTMEYSKTKDILHVQNTLGHKNIKNTLLYTQLIDVSEDKGFVCKVAKNPTEAVALIEEGFELHCCYGENDEIKLFRKRK